MAQVQYGGSQHLVIEIRLRDGPAADLCPWCEQPMDPTWQARERRDPESVTIEHIVPIVEGGTWHLDNLVLAHKRCNEKRAETKHGSRRERSKRGLT